MPWKDQTMSQQRLQFVQLVEEQHVTVAEACRRFGICRTTGYKWLKRYRKDPKLPLQNQSRQPRNSPDRTDDATEKLILDTYQLYGWGARKIRNRLADTGHNVPSINTVHRVLQRHDCVNLTPRIEPQPLQRFERSRPNELWQLDFKGPREVGRKRIHPLTIIDDHSRFLIGLDVHHSHKIAPVFERLWNYFGEVGMPQSILCDNEFNTRLRVRTISWFDAQLIKLSIWPIHGRFYHPQTQGKVERVHGTFEREMYPQLRHDCLEHFEADIQQWVGIYNFIRPHEALGDRPPFSRWRASERTRPAKMPEAVYPEGSITKKVSITGDVRWKGRRILAGYGLVGEFVRIAETDDAFEIYFCHHLVRTIPMTAFVRGSVI